MNTQEAYALKIINLKLKDYIKSLDMKAEIKRIILSGLSDYYAERVSESHNQDLLPWFDNYVDKVWIVNILSGTKIGSLSNDNNEKTEEFRIFMREILTHSLNRIEKSVYNLLDMPYTELTE